MYLYTKKCADKSLYYSTSQYIVITFVLHAIVHHRNINWHFFIQFPIYFFGLLVFFYYGYIIRFILILGGNMSLNQFYKYIYRNIMIIPHYNNILLVTIIKIITMIQTNQLIHVSPRYYSIFRTLLTYGYSVYPNNSKSI